MSLAAATAAAAACCRCCTAPPWLAPPCGRDRGFAARAAAAAVSLAVLHVSIAGVHDVDAVLFVGGHCC